LKTTRSTFALRWIGFSEDDGKHIAEGAGWRWMRIARINSRGGKAAFAYQRVEDNAFHPRERRIGCDQGYCLKNPKKRLIKIF
jgi:hypothetical protein